MVEALPSRSFMMIMFCPVHGWFTQPTAGQLPASNPNLLLVSTVVTVVLPMLLSAPHCMVHKD